MDNFNYYDDPEKETRFNETDEYDDFQFDFIPPCYPYCPYLQFYSAPQPYDSMYRQPQPTMPPGPPPSSEPMQQAQFQSGPQLKAVDPGAIRRCLFRFVYIWPRRGRGFWAWLTFVGRRSVSGYRWNGFRWVYFGMDLREISSFECR